MEKLYKVCKGADKAFKFFYYFAGAVLFALLVVSFYCVIVRAIGHPVIWSDEAQRYLMILMVFAACPYLVAAKEHLVVDLIDIFCPKNKKLLKITHFIGDFMLLAIIIYLIVPCWQLASMNATSYSTALRIPKVYIYGMMPVSFIFSGIAQVKNIIQNNFLKGYGENDKKDNEILEV